MIPIAKELPRSCRLVLGSSGGVNQLGVPGRVEKVSDLEWNLSRSVNSVAAMGPHCMVG